MSLSGDFAPIHDGHIRLSVLRLLDEQPSYSANDSLLTDAVNALGLPCTRDQMRGHITWLQEQRLVTAQSATIGLTVATITERGSEVAKGRSIIPGVQRPSAR
ncbi:VpaChn25_0724 family phage protein [Novosphingobium clariflavum]|uniref:ArsR family transcriptional regulator n=1 Tax=Novosphingobium clariflavum TaxID=2029884 RepID=A0ABV6SAY8_9SPHN|nr:hypothetical protein [Novosphingobium clariflavum]